MPGLRMFKKGFYSHIGANEPIVAGTINLGNTKGRGSSTRMFNYCNQRSANPSGCINQFINVAPAQAATPAPAPVTSATTILVYSVTQGSNFVWGGVTYTLNTSLPNYSYTAITTAIPASQVHSHTNLISVTIGNSVTIIGANAFYDCYNLLSVTIPNSVTTIGQEAFYDCYNLLSVTIPNSATIISSYAVFQGCSSLTSITIGNLVTSIGVSAFQDCIHLLPITIPDSVTSIGVAAFQGCSDLTSITLPTNPLFTTISQSVFEGSGLTSITIPTSVTSIATNAFAYCPKLTSIIIPNSVTSIGINAFQGCTLLTTVYISNAKAAALGTSLGYTWTSPGTVSSPQFYGAPNTVTLTPPDTTILEYNTSQGSSFVWGSVTFTRDTNILPNYSYTAITTSIPSSTVPDYDNLKSVIFGNNVTTIGSAVFDSCTNLTSVTLPTNLSFTSISDSVFINCSGLTSITIPNSVTIINDSAFEGCSSLSSIKIPNSVTTIGIGVFDSCTGLTSVTIGTSVTSIGFNAFQGCTGLTSITIPASVTFINTDAFLSSGLTTVHIASASQTISTIVFTAGTTVSFFGKANVSIVYP